jgi:DNA-directed RNA polymerase sigma subunit (sigma70/sigma32)
VAIYLAEIANVPPLNPGEEERCVKDYREGGSHGEIAGKRLLEANLSLVVMIAEHYRDRGIHLLDLIQSGNLGLLASLESRRQGDDSGFGLLATRHVERAIQESVATSAQ